MDLVVPIWLNLALVEKILQKSEVDDSLQVINIFVKPAINKGDNYASDIFRINAEYSRNRGEIIEQKSIIVKIAPIESLAKEVFTTSGIFNTEVLMMTDTLDKMNTLLGFKERLSGKALYVQKDNPLLLVIEDLASLGFRMADRLAGLDLDHSILAIRGLARFHAASVVVCEAEPKQKQMYLKGLFYSQYPSEIKQYYFRACKALAEEIINWPELKKYSEKITKLADRVYQVGMEASKLDKNEFNVINHGDCWVNNMMFKYNDDGKPTDHIFVDFQLSVYGSPAFDLLYFFNTNPIVDVIEDKRNVLLNEYLVILSTTMKRLSCKTQPPTMEELNAALKRRAIYGMLISFIALPLILCKKDDTKSFDELLKKNSTYTNLRYKNETYRKLMGKRIPMYDECGLLDF